MIKLSLCIPTYNRCLKLLLLLESIEKQVESYVSDEIEIIISDNASTDKTEIEVLKFIQNNSTIKIKYYKNKKNEGIDFNIKNVIDKATGEYIWLIGDDELLLNNSINNILEKISQNSDIFVLNGSQENNLNALNVEDMKVFDMKKRTEFIYYISSINNSLRFCFCLISSLVFKRDKFLKQKIPKELEKSSYDHLFYFLSMIKNGCQVSYLSDSYYEVGAEDNEWNTKRGKHFYLDLETLYKFLIYLFDEEEQKIIRIEVGKLLKRQHKSLRSYLYLFEYSSKNKKKEELKKYLQYFELDTFKINSIQKVEELKFVIRFIDFIKKKLR